MTHKALTKKRAGLSRALLGFAVVCAGALSLASCDFNQVTGDDLKALAEAAAKGREKTDTVPPGSKAPDDLSKLMSPYTVTWTDTIDSKDWKFRDDDLRNDSTGYGSVVNNRKGNIQTTYFIYGVYSYEQKRDYYLISSESIVSNSSLYFGWLRNSNWGTIYRTKGWVMIKAATNNKLKLNNKLVGGDKAWITQYSPEAANNSETYNEGFSWNIGGKVDAASDNKVTAGVSFGLSFSSNHTWSVKDIEVVSLTNTASDCKNAQWEFRGKPLTLDGYLNFSEPGHLQVSTAKFGTSWVYVVENPGVDDQYTLDITVYGQHGEGSFYATQADYATRVHDWNFAHSINLPKPKRND